MSGHRNRASHKLAPNHVPTLYSYALTFLDEGIADENTLNILLLARSLAPEVDEIGLRAAELLIRHRRADEARALLTPIAFNAHSGLQEHASSLLASMDVQTTDAAVARGGKGTGPADKAPSRP